MNITSFNFKTLIFFCKHCKNNFKFIDLTFGFIINLCMTT